jgi:transcriptional regulator with XRE-family HTH domain
MVPLREIREARGLSQLALARRAGTSQQQIDRLEKAQRRMTIAWARLLAPLLGVHPHELAPPDSYAAVVVAGYVGAGEEIFFHAERGALEPETVAAPPVEHDAAALRIESDSVSPRYRVGEFVIYARSRGADPTCCLYEDCVARLPDGRTMLKLVEPGGEPDTYTLRSYNPAIPLLVNRRVAWLAPVTWRGPRRRSGV